MAPVGSPNPTEPSQRLRGEPTYTSKPGALSGHVRLRVKNARGTVESIEFGNMTVPMAVRRAVSRGFTVLSIEGESVGTGSIAESERLPSGHFPLLLFSQELLALLEAGLNLTEALDTLVAPFAACSNAS